MKTNFFLLEKWWVIPLISVGIISALFYFDSGNIWLIGFSILLLTFSTTRLLIIKKRILGFFSALILFGLMAFSLVIYSRHHIVPSKEKIHEIYAKKYENKDAVERITGVEIPAFIVLDSRITHIQTSDFEFDTVAEIEFLQDLNDDFFHQLDSITQLPQPEDVNKKSNYFYNSLGSIGRCWQKDGEIYKYSRDTDFGENFLHSTDAYFYLTLEKGSRKATLNYGNY